MFTGYRRTQGVGDQSTAKGWQLIDHSKGLATDRRHPEIAGFFLFGAYLNLTYIQVSIYRFSRVTL